MKLLAVMFALLVAPAAAHPKSAAWLSRATVKEKRSLKTLAPSKPAIATVPPAAAVNTHQAVLSLRGGADATELTCIGMAAIYSFFGVTLAAAPAWFWGPNSIFSYWTEMDESGVWFGRALGIWMATVTTSPWTLGMDMASLVKVYLPMNILFMAMFIQASFSLKTTGPAPQNVLPFNMWYTQLPIAAGLLAMNAKAVMG